MVSGTLHRRGQQVAEWLAGWLLLSRRIETACSESDGGLLLDPRLIPREKVARGEGRMSLAGTWLGRLTLSRWSIDQIIHQWTGSHSCAIPRTPGLRVEKRQAKILCRNVEGMLGRRRIIASHRPPGPRACVPNARAVHPLTHSQIFTHRPPPPSPLKVSSPGVSLVQTPPREPCISRGSSPVERCPCARSHPAPSIPTGRPARRRNATVHLPCPDLTRLFQVPGRFQQ